MNGKTSIDFDGAGLGQYPQYPMLSMKKASCSYEYIQRYYRMPKKEIANKFRTYHYSTSSYKKKNQTGSHKKKKKKV